VTATSIEVMEQWAGVALIHLSHETLPRAAERVGRVNQLGGEAGHHP
jgi:hypothetical protein